ncbi:MAG: hypothetical protein JW781_09770, partial [Deltaproteobacteria bacterium]|nr:hypothetical protein [Candidatus Anaeroferrophillacea bacterium]
MADPFTTLYLHLKKLFVSDIYRNADHEVVRKVMLMHGMALVGMVYLSVYGFITLRQGRLLITAFDFGTFLALGVTLLMLRRTGNYILCGYLGVSAMYILFTFFFVTGGVNGTGFMWLYSFPLFTMFLLGSHDGAVASLLLLTAATTFMVHD